jgi:hypothetical protein
MFSALCVRLLLDQQKEAEKLGIKSTAAGLEVSVGHLFALCYTRKLDANFEFELGIITVFCEIRHAKGVAAINMPEAIANTEVDSTPVSGSKEGFESVGPGAPDGSETLTTLDSELTEETAEDDPF